MFRRSILKFYSRRLRREKPDLSKGEQAYFFREVSRRVRFVQMGFIVVLAAVVLMVGALGYAGELWQGLTWGEGIVADLARNIRSWFLGWTG